MLASFNKDITANDVIGKLKAVCYSREGYVCYASALIDENDNLVLHDESLGDVVLVIEGKNLYVTPDGDQCYIFDVDFDEQHKKVWDINDAGYLLEMPDLILPGSPTKRYLEVSASYDSDDGLYFHMRVNNLDDSDGYQPITNTAELDDSDVDSWFNDGTGSSAWGHIESLIKKIIPMEYNIQADELFVFADTDAFEIDGGTLNLLTDGSPAPRPQPVVPLQIVSRFPNGSPVSGQSEGQAILATFNREFARDELVGKLQIISDINTTTPVLGLYAEYQSEDDPNVLLMTDSDDGTEIELYIDGRNIVSSDLFGHIWDIDYDQQHKRAFTKGDGTYQLIMPETCSEINNVKMYPFVRAAVTTNNLELDVIVNNSKVVVNDIELNDQAEGTIIGNLSLEELKVVLFELIHLEYDKSVNIVDTYSDENPIVPDGTLNLLTD